MQVVSLNICAAEDFAKKFHRVLYYSLRVVEPAGSPLILNGRTVFWQVLLFESMFSRSHDTVNERGETDECTLMC